MEEKNLCPYKVLLIVTDQERNTEKTILACLKKYNIKKSMVSLAEGTADSAISDIFGFGIVDRIVFSTFIPSVKAEEIVATLQEKLEKDKKNKGIIMTLPITALSSNILEIWRIKDESKAKRRKI